MRPSILPIICCAALAACNTTSPQEKRYSYPEPRASGGATIRFASTDGRFIGLSDGSLWNVDWSGASAAKSFRAGQPVSVRKVGGGSFPYRLSTPGGGAVAARYGKKLD